MDDCYSSDCTGISSGFSYLNFILECERCIPVAWLRTLPAFAIA